MKRFTVSILFAVVFFMGLGSLLQKSQANSKSDERALTLIRQAREALGGEANLNNVRSLSIVGKATKTIEINDAPSLEQGDWEMNFQLPNQLSESMKIVRGDGAKIGEHSEIMEKSINVVVTGKGNGTAEAIVTEEPTGEKHKVVIVKKGEGEPMVVTPDGENKVLIVKKGGDGNATWTTEGGKTAVINKDVRIIHDEKPRSNELFRTTFALLLSAPEGLEVNYTYAGEGNVDGASCDIVQANSGESAYKLYLDKSSHLPKMITFQGRKPMIMMFKKTEGAKVEAEKDVKIFTRTSDAPEMAEFQIKFTDYRNVNGVQFPFKWEQTVGGKADRTIDITNYEVNPANIADKFGKKEERVFIRTKKPE